MYSVGVCNNSFDKTSSNSIPPTSYSLIREQWVYLCAQIGEFNSDSCHICSDHFQLDGFEKDFKAELMNLPTKLLLNLDAILSRNYREIDINTTEKSTSNCLYCSFLDLIITNCRIEIY